MRQVGKTTLIKQVFDEITAPKIWFDFDNPLDMLLFEEIDYNNIFLKLEKASNANGERIFVFIDEIQNLPEITKIIKYHIDHYNVKYIKDYTLLVLKRDLINILKRYQEYLANE